MKIKINSYSKKDGKRKGRDIYEWKIFIDENRDILDKIEQVQYLLHETFTNPVRIVKDRASKFALKSSGWGNFTTYISIKFKDGSEEEFEYYLDLKKGWPIDQKQASNSKLVFIGQLSIDEVENYYYGKNIQPGGGALYAAVGARTISPNVSLISAIGKDYEFLDVLDQIDSKDVRVYNMPSTRSYIKYDRRWEWECVSFDQNVGSKITSGRISNKWFKSNNVFHIGPMKASNVLKILNKIKTNSPGSIVSVITSEIYMEGEKTRRIFKDIAQKSDFFILNDTEAKALAQTDSLSSAVRLLKAKHLIVTLGSLGAIISGDDVGIQMVPALTLPPDKVVDTTGAGDVWCGAFLATYDLTEDFAKSVSVASTISRIKCSDWGFQSLINLRFKEPNDVIEFVMGLKEGGIQKNIRDYTEM